MNSIQKSVTGLIIATPMLFSACSASGTQSGDKAATGEDSLVLAVENYINNDTLFQEMLQQFPEERRATIIEQTRANAILLKYLKLTDRRYSLEITEAEAEKLGVKPDYYRQCLSELENTNRTIAEQDSIGTPIELLDPQEMIKQAIETNLR